MTSAIANGIINEIVDSGDSAIGSADYVADAAMVLASFAAGDSYCSVAALMKSETWSAVAETVKQANAGNQEALEATGGCWPGFCCQGRNCHILRMPVRVLI